MTIIPESQTFDQRTLTLMQEHEPVVQRYRQFFALFAWTLVPEPPLDPSRPGKRPHPETAYLKTLLIKLVEGYDSCTMVRRFLLEHPLLVLEVCFRPVLNRSLPYGFDVAKTTHTARWLRQKQRSLSQPLLQARRQALDQQRASRWLHQRRERIPLGLWLWRRQCHCPRLRRYRRGRVYPALQ